LLASRIPTESFDRTIPTKTIVCARAKNVEEEEKKIMVGKFYGIWIVV